MYHRKKNKQTIVDLKKTNENETKTLINNETEGILEKENHWYSLVTEKSDYFE